jgi:regulatory protein
MGRGPRAPRESGSGREDPARRAEAYALDLLALRPRTVRELSARLRSKGYAEETIADLVSRAERAGYLDDRKFAAAWVEERCRSFPCGPARLRAELGQKGVDDRIVSTVLAEHLPPEREAALAVRVASKRAPSEAAAKKKLWDLLRRRGFGGRACEEALRVVYGPLDELEG